MRGLLKGWSKTNQNLTFDFGEQVIPKAAMIEQLIELYRVSEQHDGMVNRTLKILFANRGVTRVHDLIDVSGEWKDRDELILTIRNPRVVGHIEFNEFYDALTISSHNVEGTIAATEGWRWLDNSSRKCV